MGRAGNWERKRKTKIDLGKGHLLRNARGGATFSYSFLRWEFVSVGLVPGELEDERRKSKKKTEVRRDEHGRHPKNHDKIRIGDRTKGKQIHREKKIGIYRRGSYISVQHVQIPARTRW